MNALLICNFHGGLFVNIMEDEQDHLSSLLHKDNIDEIDFLSSGKSKLNDESNLLPVCLSLSSSVNLLIGIILNPF